MKEELSYSKVAELFKENHPDQAIALARSRDTRSSRDAGLHVKWADLLEELGLINEVIQELNLAIRDDPERQETYARLAEIYLDQGQPLRAGRVCSELIKKDPTNSHYYEELGHSWEEASEFEKARQVYQLALEKTGGTRFSSLLKNLSFMEAPEEFSEKPVIAEQLLPQTHHLVTFTTLFAGRGSEEVWRSVGDAAFTSSSGGDSGGFPPAGFSGKGRAGEFDQASSGHP